MKLRIICLVIFSGLFFIADTASAQSKFAAWGNIMGIRKHGQLFGFETSLEVVGEDGSNPHSTFKEKQRPHYTRDGNQQTVTTNINNVYFKETVEDKSEGKISVNLQTTVKSDTTLQGLFFCISLSEKEYAGATLQLENENISDFQSSSPFETTATGMNVSSAQRKFKISFAKALPVSIKHDTINGNNNVLIYLQLAQGTIHKGDTISCC